MSKGGDVVVVKPKKAMSTEDAALLKKYYDKDRSGTLSDDEIKALVTDFKNVDKDFDPKIRAILRAYDEDQDGSLDESEVSFLVDTFKSTDSNARYAAYSVAFARAFRYLAFTSDFGEALRVRTFV